jgi:PAS domain S-box-containing protein
MNNNLLVDPNRKSLNNSIPILEIAQKRNNKSLVNSEMRYRRLFESAKDGILIIDPFTAAIVDANPFFIDLLGYPSENIIGKQLWEIGAFRNKDESKRAFNELIRNRYIRFDDMPLLRKNGQIVEVEFVSNVYEVNRIDVIQCNIRDITQRKLTEKKLRESEQLLSKTQKIAMLGSFNFSFDNEELNWSDELFTIFGIRKDSFRLTVEAFIHCIHPNDKSTLLNWVKQTTLGKNPGDLDFRIVRPDKITRNIYGIGVLEVDRDGKPKRIVGSMQDITERKHTKKELKESENHFKEQNLKILLLNKKYQALNEDLKSTLDRIQRLNDDLIIARDKAEESEIHKTAFIANISHVIRTPLNAIIGFSELLMNTVLPKRKIEQYIQVINTNGNQLFTVVNDMIDIPATEAGRTAVHTERVNIDLLLKEIHTTFKEQFQQKSIALNYYPNPEYLKTESYTDPNRVKQVLCNLLNNALKFTLKGEVILGFNINEKLIEFYVKDTGIGIASLDQEFILDRFRKIENSHSQSHEGNGLGLSISKSLVEMLGGTLSFHSKPGKGSTFFFTIPLAERINSSILTT